MLKVLKLTQESFHSSTLSNTNNFRRLRRVLAFPTVRFGNRVGKTINLGLGWLAVFATVLLLVAGYNHLFADPLVQDWMLNKQFPIFVASDLAAGFVSVAVLKMFFGRRHPLAPLAIVSLVAIYLQVHASQFDPVSAIAGGLLAQVLLARNAWSKRLAMLWATMVCGLWLMYLTANWQPNAASLSQEPNNLRPDYCPWTNDLQAWLNIFYLMKRGVNYYRAFLVCEIKVDYSSYFNWRGPFLHYFWLLLPNGAWIYGEYALLLAVAMLSVFLMFRKRSTACGLLAVTVMIPYFTIGLGSYWFLEYEFWGSLFSIFAFALYAIGRRKTSVVPAFLAAACKELLLGALLGGLIASLLRRNLKETAVWVGGCLIFGAYSYWNYLGVRAVTNIDIGVSPWLGNGGPSFIDTTFNFAASWLPAHSGWLFIVLAVLGVVLLKPRELSAYALCTTVLPVVVFWFIGAKWEWYWGVVYVPFVLLMIATLVMRLTSKLKSRAEELVRQPQQPEAQELERRVL